mmetsp:Transcript_46537/g.149382  ORF Transcript_46537/g.149382 Transcript_46537/m.149382 type:complete len:363 (+) Transcript_46537:559-1647(+)
MLVDDIGDVTITNDGATILKQLEVEHPAAKVRESHNPAASLPPAGVAWSHAQPRSRQVASAPAAAAARNQRCAGRGGGRDQRGARASGRCGAGLRRGAWRVGDPPSCRSYRGLSRRLVRRGGLLGGPTLRRPRPHPPLPPRPADSRGACRAAGPGGWRWHHVRGHHRLGAPEALQRPRAQQDPPHVHHQRHAARYARGVQVRGGAPGHPRGEPPLGHPHELRAHVHVLQDRGPGLGLLCQDGGGRHLQRQDRERHGARALPCQGHQHPQGARQVRQGVGAPQRLRHQRGARGPGHAQERAQRQDRMPGLQPAEGQDADGHPGQRDGPQGARGHPPARGGHHQGAHPDGPQRWRQRCLHHQGH